MPAKQTSDSTTQKFASTSVFLGIKRIERIEQVGRLEFAGMHRAFAHSLDLSDRAFRGCIRSSFIARDFFRNQVPIDYAYGYDDCFRIKSASEFYSYCHPFQYKADHHRQIQEAFYPPRFQTFTKFLSDELLTDDEFSLFWVSAYSCCKDHHRNWHWNLLHRAIGPTFKCFLFEYKNEETWYEVHINSTKMNVIERAVSTLSRSRQVFEVPFSNVYVHSNQNLDYSKMKLTDVSLQQ